MTTRIVIQNDPTSNPLQHLKVSCAWGGQTQDILLAPGESWSQWISTDHTIAVCEVFSPKPAQEVQDQSSAPEGGQAAQS